MAFQRQQGIISYAPKNNNGETVAASSHERVKWHLLDLQFEMERNLSEFMAHQNYGASQALLSEHLHSCILNFFESCRPHILGYFVKEEQRINKCKKPNEKARREKYLAEQRESFKLLDGSFESFYAQQKLKPESLKKAIRFLVQFLWDIGVSNIERPERDPIKDFSIAAYGQDLTDDEEET